MRLIFWLAAIGFASLVHGGENQIELKTELIGSSQKISVIFPREMVSWPLSSTTAVESHIRPIVTPRVSCQWEWLSERMMRCMVSGDQQLVRATRYTLKVPAQKGLDGKTVDAFQQEFETQRPYLSYFDEHWTSSTDGKLRVYFSDDIKPASLAGRLTLVNADDTQRIPLNKWKRQKGDRFSHQFSIKLPSDLRAGARYLLKVDAGILPAVGNLPSKSSEHVNAVVVPDKFDYLGWRCASKNDGWHQFSLSGQTERCEPVNGVDLWFSNALDSASLDVLRVALDAEKIVQDSWVYNSQNGGPARRLAQIHVYGLRSNASNKLDQLSLVDIWQRKLTLSDVQFTTNPYPETVTVELKQNQFLPSDPIDIPIKLINATEIIVELKYVGANGAQQQDLRWPVPGFVADQWMKVNMPLHHYLPPDATLVQGSIKSSDGVLIERFNFNRTTLELTTQSLNGTLIGWVRDRVRKAAVNDATIELMKGESTRLSTAKIKSGNDGVFQLTVPVRMPPPESSDRAPHENLWLRISKDGVVSAHPFVLDSGRGGWDTSDRDAEYLREGVNIVWGVTDKHLYAPGERVNYRVFVRQRHDNALRCDWAGKTLHMAVLEEEEGRTVIDGGEINLDQLCSYNANFVLPEKLAHGNYHVLVRDRAIDNSTLRDDDGWASQTIRGRFTFEVANPKPPAINVALSAGKKEWNRQDKTVSYTVNATYFSGGPLPRANAEVVSRFSIVENGLIDPRAEKFPSYVFELDNAQDILDSDAASTETRKMKTGDAGSITLQAKRPPWLPGLAAWRADAEISGDDGQTYYNSLPYLMVYSSDYFAGLKLNSWWLQEGNTIRFDAIVLDRNAQMSGGKPLQMELWERRKKPDGTIKRGKLIQQCQLMFDKQPVNCPISAKKAGLYELVAKTPSSATAFHQASVMFRVYPKTFGSGFEFDDEELVLEADKKEYRVGDVAKLRFVQPFSSSRALLTIQRDRLLHSEWITINQNEHNFELTVTEAMKNGATVALQLFDVPKPENRWDSAWQASLALNVVAPRPSQLQLRADRSSHAPGDDVELNVELPDGAGRGLMLSVVDSALLQLIDKPDQFFNPDNHRFLGAMKRWTVGVDTVSRGWITEDPIVIADRMLRNLPVARDMHAVALFAPGAETIEVVGARPSSIEGRDQSAKDGAVLPPDSKNAAQNRAAKIRNYFRQTAFWLPAATLDQNGKASIRFSLPDNLTQWTVLAFSYDKDDAFDFSKAEFTASLPIEVRLTAPQNVVVGDRIGVNAVVRNATQNGQTLKAEIKLADADLAQAKTLSTQNMRLKGFEGKPLAAEHSTSAEQRTRQQLTWVAQAGNDVAHDAVSMQTSVELPIAPRVFVKTIALQPSEAFNLALSRPGDSWQHEGHLSWRPIDVMTGVNESAHYMKRYPHRCWEQRTSRMLVAVMAERLTRQNTFDWQNNNALADWLSQLPNFQAPNGGFSYWRSENSYVDLHLSLYTAQTFARLRKLGWTGGQREEQHLLDFLAKPSHENNSRQWTDADFAMSLSLQLTPTDRTQRSESLLERADKLALIDKAYLLAGLPPELAATSRAQRLRDLIKTDVSETYHFVELNRGNLGWLWRGSDQLTRCVGASALLTTANSEAEKLYALKWLRAAQVHRQSDGAFGSTNESAQCLWTIGEFTEQQKSSSRKTPILEMAWANESVQAEAKRVMPIALTDKTTVTVRNPSNSPALVELRYEYNGDTRMNQHRELGLKINRHYEVFKQNRWLSVTPANVEVGDWVRVTLKFTAAESGSFVAVSDPVPGGLVAVDPDHDATVPVQRLGELEQSYGFYHKEMADGVARFYADALYRGEHTIQYFAKAITFGEYQALPAKVEMMYAPDNYGTTGVDVMKIKQAVVIQKP